MLGGPIYGVVGMHPPPPPMTANLQPPTWNGEPCPVHGAGLHHSNLAPMSMTPYPALYSSMSMRRAASIHELAAMAATPLPALMPPPPASAIYGTLPGHPPAPQFVMQAEPFMVMAPGPPSMIAGPPASVMGGRMMGRPHPPMRSGPGSLPPMPPPSLQPRGHLGRPIVVNGKNGQPEPLPVRDAPPLPPKIPPSMMHHHHPSASDAASRAASKSSGSAAKPFSYRSCCQGNVVVLWVILGIIGLGVVMTVVFYYAFK